MRPGEGTLNRNLSLEVDGYALAIVRLVILGEDLRAQNRSLFDSFAGYTVADRIHSDLSADADFVLQSIVAELKPNLPVYRIMVPAGSILHNDIKSGRTILRGFTSFPQIILYRNGRPYKYMNGNLADRDEVSRFMAQVVAYIYFDPAERTEWGSGYTSGPLSM